MTEFEDKTCRAALDADREKLIKEFVSGLTNDQILMKAVDQVLMMEESEAEARRTVDQILIITKPWLEANAKASAEARLFENLIPAFADVPINVYTCSHSLRETDLPII